MYKIVQWNWHGIKININELLLLITNQSPTVVCLQQKLLNDKLNIEENQQYDYIRDTRLQGSCDTSILVRNDVPQSKINLTTTI